MKSCSRRNCLEKLFNIYRCTEPLGLLFSAACNSATTKRNLNLMTSLDVSQPLIALCTLLMNPMYVCQLTFCASDFNCERSNGDMLHACICVNLRVTLSKQMSYFHVS